MAAGAPGWRSRGGQHQRIGDSGLFDASESDLSNTYRAVAANSGATSRSSTVKLVKSAPSFTQQPVVTAPRDGTSLTFTITATATGTPVPTIAWQYQAPGAPWQPIGSDTNVGSVTSGGVGTLTITATFAQLRYAFRAVAANGEAPDAVSDTVALYSAPIASFSSQPHVQDSGAGSYRVAASVSDIFPMTFTYEYQPLGATSWLPLSGTFQIEKQSPDLVGSRTALRIWPDAAQLTARWRIVADDGATPRIVSDTFVLFDADGAAAPIFTTQPSTPALYAPFVWRAIAAQALGEAGVRLEWVYRRPGQTTWTLIGTDFHVNRVSPPAQPYAGGLYLVVSTLNIAPLGTEDGTQIAARALDSAGRSTLSAIITLTLDPAAPPAFITQPSGILTHTAGTAVAIAARATGGPGTTVTWRYRLPGASAWRWWQNLGANGRFTIQTSNNGATSVLNYTQSAAEDGIQIAAVAADAAGHQRWSTFTTVTYSGP